VIVNFYATLRQIVGKKTVDLDIPENSTAHQVLDEVIRTYPGLKKELLDGNGELYGHVHMLINGRDVCFLNNGLDTVITKEDTINFFPAIGGGRG
jgi:molybdopterin synthase sulfur carrier subunit